MDDLEQYIMHELLLRTERWMKIEDNRFLNGDGEPVFIGDDLAKEQADTPVIVSE